jgi:hypothetical protein
VFAIRKFRRGLLWLTLAKIRTCSKVAGVFASLSINPVGKSFDDWLFAYSDLSNGLVVLVNTLPAALGSVNQQVLGWGWLRRR